MHANLHHCKLVTKYSSKNGPHPNKWDPGVVLESLGHDQYCVKVDDTGRITKGNRRYLRHYTLPLSTMTPKSHSNSRPVNEPSEPLQMLTHRLTDSNCSPAKQPANDCKLTLPNEQDRIASQRSCSPVDSHIRAPVQTDTPVPLLVSTPMPRVLSTPAKRGPGRPPKE